MRCCNRVEFYGYHAVHDHTLPPGHITGNLIALWLFGSSANVFFRFLICSWMPSLCSSKYLNAAERPKNKHRIWMRICTNAGLLRRAEASSPKGTLCLLCISGSSGEALDNVAGLKGTFWSVDGGITWPTHHVMIIKIITDRPA